MLSHSLLFLVALSQAVPELSAQDQNRAFTAAGFSMRDGQWHSACIDEGDAYVSGTLDLVDDLDGDGKPEAIITEASSACFGEAGTAFALVSKQAGGEWRLLMRANGYATPLSGRGIIGFPDIEVGGAGECYPVFRWEEGEYRLNRHQYEGRPCQP